MKEYNFRPGYHVPKGVTADAAGAELDRICSKHGHLKASVVVDEARVETSPIHCAFEWDDSVAAEAYRERQAMGLIRSVIIIEKEKPEIHAFTLVIDKVDNSPVKYYLPTEEVAGDEVKLESAKRLIIRQLSALERSLEELETISGKRNRKAKKAIKELQIALK